MLREGKSTAGDFRIPSGCAVSSVFSRSGKRLDGSDIIRSIEIMHDRSNGLGGGFEPAEPDAEAPDAVAAFAAPPVVLCGAQPASPAKAARPAVAAAPVKNERRLSVFLSDWFMVPPLID